MTKGSASCWPSKPNCSINTPNGHEDQDKKANFDDKAYKEWRKSLQETQPLNQWVTKGHKTWTSSQCSTSHAMLERSVQTLRTATTCKGWPWTTTTTTAAAKARQNLTEQRLLEIQILKSGMTQSRSRMTWTKKLEQTQKHKNWLSLREDQYDVHVHIGRRKPPKKRKICYHANKKGPWMNHTVISEWIMM
jgi:hypothetical protein